MLDMLCSFKAVAFGVGGVLTNNQDINGEIAGAAFKGFVRSHYDGQGVSLLRAIGIKIAFVATEPSFHNDQLQMLVERWNDLPSCLKGDWPRVTLIDGVYGEKQVPPVEAWLQGLGLTFADCAVMGHDLVSVPLLRKGALQIVPADAEEVVKSTAHFITSRGGGNGALRDFANMVLKARGINPTTLPTR